VIYIATLLHDIAKGRLEDHSIAGAKVARRLCPRLASPHRRHQLVAWLIEEHLTMSTVRIRATCRTANHRELCAVVQSVEQMKLLTILTTPISEASARGVER